METKMKQKPTKTGNFNTGKNGKMIIAFITVKAPVNKARKHCNMNMIL